MTQASGLSEMRQSRPRSHHPVYLPSRYIRLSPNSMADSAKATHVAGERVPRAAAPPAISRPSAAGTGIPMASRNTITNRME